MSCDIGDPVAQRLVHRIFQRARAGGDAAHFRAEQMHAEDIGLLPLDIHLAHVDDAGQTEARRDRGGGDAMLAGAGFRDDARLAHAARQQNLAEAIVDLVRAGVVEVFALQIDLRAAEMRRQPFGEIERARPADIMLQQSVQLGVKGWIVLRFFVGPLEIEHQRHQRLGDKAAAIGAKMAALVRSGAIGIGRERAHASAPAKCRCPRCGDESRR